jgi:hypothetical protein
MPAMIRIGNGPVVQNDCAVEDDDDIVTWPLETDKTQTVNIRNSKSAIDLTGNMDAIMDSTRCAYLK